MKIFFFTATTAVLLFCSVSFAENSASFDWFSYEGKDGIFDEKLKEDHYFNPIIAGYYPDPSIVRVEDDYYLVNSSFAYFPGLPIFHSKDLVHWQQIGHALNRRSQLTFEKGQAISHGIYAPTLRYHDGLFYIITTDVYGIGNFYISAQNPAGPWSEPVTLPEIGGIDPDLFFDDDGRVYIAHNNGPEGTPLYEGHRAIWLWEFDLKHKKVIKDSGRVIVNGGVDISKKPIWIEGPHIYKVKGWYYLSCAEGGTGDDHSEVIFRTKNLNEPFIPYESNPILTQRDLHKGRTNPVTSVGHADFVETATGDWWAVFLGVRPYFDKSDGHQYHNTGRETFMLPLGWENGWPRILKAQTVLPLQVDKPHIATSANVKNVPPQTGNFSWQDGFNTEALQANWVSLRTSPLSWYELDNKKGILNLQAQAYTLKDKVQPSYLGRRQQHQNFRASTKLIALSGNQISAGLVLFQNSDYHYYLGLKKQGNTYSLFLEETLAGKTTVTQQKNIKLGKDKGIILGAKQVDANLNFFYIDKAGKEKVFASDIPASNISTQRAGGFVGVTIGLHSRLAEAVPGKSI